MSHDYHLLVRPDLDELDQSNSPNITLSTLADKDGGQTIHSFLIEVSGVFEYVPTPPDMTRIVYICGQMITGEAVVCELTYDDNDQTQMLAIEDINR